MRILKFVVGGMFGLFLLSVIFKALFFMVLAGMLIGGVMMAKRAFGRMNGYHHHPYAMRSPYMQKRWQQQPFANFPIESIDDIVNRQSFNPARPYAERPSTYKEVDLI